MTAHWKIIGYIIINLVVSHECRNVEKPMCLNKDKVKGQMEGKVVDGRYVSIREYPHVAVVTVGCSSVNSAKNHISITQTCSGSILNQFFVLTSAHCMTCQNTKDEFGYIGIGVGTDNRMKINHLAESHVIHCDYVAKSFTNDIALIKSRTQFAFSETVQRAILMRKPIKANIAYLASWGIANIEDKKSMWLKATSMSIEPNSKCGLRDGPEKFCAITPVPPTGDCDDHMSGFSRLDFGAGVMVNKSIIIGIRTQGADVNENNVRVGTKLFITNVSYHYDWIKKTMRKMYCKPT